MKTHLRRNLFATALVVMVALTTTHSIAVDPLASWNDGPAKQSIITFVEKVTKSGAPDFVPVPERIAVFDNDGTLWCEQPIPVQLYFALDRVKTLAPQHPEWKDKEPFASLLKGDLKSALAGGEHAIMEFMMATHTGMTTVEFEQIVKDWIANAKHPTTGKRFLDMTYQPMLEVLDYLRANEFKTYIVSGGGIEFMRPWVDAAYGIPPEQVVGSSVKTKFEMRDGKPVLVRLSELNFNDDKGGKPVAINLHVGRVPIAAFGNSVGDQQMLEYTQGGGGARFELLVLHDDSVREFPYGPARGLPDVKLGYFTPALEEHAKKNGWTIVSMKDDWKTVFATAQSEITAIDILLQPDATMLQCFVRTADLEKVYAAAGKVIANAKVTGLKLEAYKYYYAPGGAVGVAGICAKPTPEILKLQADLIAAVKPLLAETGPIGSFTAPHGDAATDASLIQYVSTFVPKMSGENFNPHVSTGVAPKEYLDQMLAEPFKTFSFSPAGAAVYQLGPFGTAAKKLKQFELE